MTFGYATSLGPLPITYQAVVAGSTRNIFTINADGTVDFHMSNEELSSWAGLDPGNGEDVGSLFVRMTNAAADIYLRDLYQGALYPEMFNRLAGSGDDDTAAIDEMFDYARTNNKRCVRLGPKTYKYDGEGALLTGYTYNIRGFDHLTTFHRTTDGPLLIYDIRTQSGGLSSIGGFRMTSALADGVRPNTRVCKVLSGENPYRLNSVHWSDINASGLEDIIWFDKTDGDPFAGYDQLGRYFGHRFRNLSSDGNAGSQCKNGIVWSAGTGSHHQISDCVLACLNLSVTAGDGDQAVHDITIGNSHLLGAVGGVRMLGPTNPAYYNKNVNIAGCQFDGNGSYTWSFENMSKFRVIPNNTLSGVGPVLTNCSGPYLYEDENGGIYAHTWEAPNLNNAVNRPRLNASITGSAVGVEAVGSDTNIGITLTPKGSGQITLGGGSPIVSSSNGIIATGTGGMRRSVDTDYLRLAGGNLTTAGALLSLYGGSHATLPKRAYLDADQFELRTQDGVTQMLTGTSSRVKAHVPLELPSYTVATLPSGAVARSAYATNLRVFNGAGTQEGAGSGTGGAVEHNGSAWKISGTNVTAVA